MSCSSNKFDNGLLYLLVRFSCFVKLEELYFVGNYFESFFVFICDFINVKKFYMDNCIFRKILREIENMLNLVVVDLSFNSFGSFDSLLKEFFYLLNIKDLYLIDC